MTPTRPRVHQILATLGYGDAIGNEVLGIRRALRGAGYDSEIIVETADPRLEDETVDYRDMVGELTADGADTWSPGQALENWVDFTRHLLGLHDRILAASAVMRFTGSSGEHLTITGVDGVRVPADAAYISTLSRRMDRHARLGKLMLGASPVAADAAAAEPESIAV